MAIDMLVHGREHTKPRDFGIYSINSVILGTTPGNTETYSHEQSRQKGNQDALSVSSFGDSELYLVANGGRTGWRAAHMAVEKTPEIVKGELKRTDDPKRALYNSVILLNDHFLQEVAGTHTTLLAVLRRGDEFYYASCDSTSLYLVTPNLNTLVNMPTINGKVKQFSTIPLGFPTKDNTDTFFERVAEELRTYHRDSPLGVELQNWAHCVREGNTGVDDVLLNTVSSEPVRQWAGQFRQEHVDHEMELEFGIKIPQDIVTLWLQHQFGVDVPGEIDYDGIRPFVNVDDLEVPKDSTVLLTTDSFRKDERPLTPGQLGDIFRHDNLLESVHHLFNEHLKNGYRHASVIAVRN